ncbi:hypothetical protein P0O24_02660 [Methanotrichaceae archaeon M04Ac]|uniref:PIN domain-containing protein n=1 Tax=Candidatus Methanocrinis alkalitolerans TaxID=3033395 RepID=A0ABT5XCV1_9EURY|nr:hypothetical protein [Candidatus Methanocrinis alkalitolerans]MDF0592483.1 hypothetical protein [Candidatus Methanocrinis alkalitolerans]
MPVLDTSFIVDLLRGKEEALALLAVVRLELVDVSNGNDIASDLRIRTQIRPVIKSAIL